MFFVCLFVFECANFCEYKLKLIWMLTWLYVRASLVVKNLPANVGDLGSIPGSERSPGEGNGNPLQYSYLDNSMGRGVWKAAVRGTAKSWTLLNDWALPGKNSSPLYRSKVYFIFTLMLWFYNFGLVAFCRDLLIGLLILNMSLPLYPVPTPCEVAKIQIQGLQILAGTVRAKAVIDTCLCSGIPGLASFLGMAYWLLWWQLTEIYFFLMPLYFFFLK